MSDELILLKMTLIWALFLNKNRFFPPTQLVLLWFPLPAHLNPTCNFMLAFSHFRKQTGK